MSKTLSSIGFKIHQYKIILIELIIFLLEHVGGFDFEIKTVHFLMKRCEKRET